MPWITENVVWEVFHSQKIVAKERKSDVIVCDQDFKYIKYFAGSVS